MIQINREPEAVRDSRYFKEILVIFDGVKLVVPNNTRTQTFTHFLRALGRVFSSTMFYLDHGEEI